MANLVIDNHLIEAPIIDILKAVKKELYNGKLSIVQEKGDRIRVNCPVHKDGMESHPSCGIYCGDDPDIPYGSWNCFTCGAHGNLYQFIARCFDKPDSWGKEWLLSHFGNVFVTQNVILPEITLSKTNKEYLNESVLDGLQSWHPYLDSRKLSKKVCEVFKIKYDPKSECIVFPVYDEYNKLYMLTRRSVKNKNFYIDADKEKPIYLLNYIKEKNLTEATLVESQINCLTLWSWGIPSIASFGCNITDHQLNLLNRSGIRHLYICYDGDDAGRHGIKKVLKGIRKDIFVDIIVMDEGKDVNDITSDRFDSLPIIDRKDWLERYGK